LVKGEKQTGLWAVNYEDQEWRRSSLQPYPVCFLECIFSFFSQHCQIRIFFRGSIQGRWQ